MSFTGDVVHKFIKDFYTKTTEFGELEVYDVTVVKMGTPVYKQLLENIHEDTHKKFIGCGFPDASALQGMHVLDIGSGYGRDVYLYSQMVGENGHVTGVDITAKSLISAKSKIEYHMEKFGYSKPNVEFLEGNVEALSFIPDSSIDVIYTEAVTCLVPGKTAMLSELYRVLKPGGEFCNLDIYATAEQFEELKSDPVMWAEGFGGSFYWKGFVDQCKGLGFATPIFGFICGLKAKESGARKRLQNNDELYQKFSKIQYANISYRAFKVDTSGSSPATVIYQGGIPFFEKEYPIDVNTVFKKGQPVTVGPEYAAILKQSRLSKFFTISAATGEIQTKDTLQDPFEWLKQTQA